MFTIFGRFEFTQEEIDILMATFANRIVREIYGAMVKLQKAKE